MRTRLYTELLRHHFATNRQMAFLSGPRQVGKTTVGRQLQERRGVSAYFNWDVPDDRLTILGGASELATQAGLEHLGRDTLVVLDELHKAPDWKMLLKGLFDGYSDRADILVTGSGNLETFRSGGESLMGRYFPYRMHPLSLGELVDGTPPGERLLRTPADVGEALDQLCEFGGFPEPFDRADTTFYNRWRRLRTQQLVREEVANLTAIQELDRLEILTELVRRQAGELMNYTTISNRLKVTVDTVTRWLATLSALYYCFEIRPWHKNIARALRKQPKYYLHDWSAVADPGKRRENLVAAALLKSTNLWTDLGYGEFGVYFIRDKQQREIDFVVTRDDQPWFLVEVKSSDSRLSPALHTFAAATGAAHALQVVFESPYVDRDCFATSSPVIVPARTFLSQLA